MSTANPNDSLRQCSLGFISFTPTYELNLHDSATLMRNAVLSFRMAQPRAHPTWLRLTEVLSPILQVIDFNTPRAVAYNYPGDAASMCGAKEAIFGGGS